MVIIYHRADLDGIGSAAVVYQWCKENYNDIDLNKDIKFIGYDYRDNTDPIIESIPIGDVVIFVDCCLEPMTKLLDVWKKTECIHLLDHHASNLITYDKMEKDGLLKCLDVNLENAKTNTYSGIYLTWKKFFPYSEVPKVVDYISRYDTWKHENNTDITDFYVGLNHHIYNPKYGYKNSLWNVLFSHDEQRIKEITTDGKLIREYMERQNYMMCLEGATEIEIDGKRGIALNTPYRGSQNIQGINRTKYDFLMVFAFLGDIWRYSIYTEQPNVNASEIAKKFGGGGHKGAAGFETHELISEIINGKKYRV